MYPKDDFVRNKFSVIEMYYLKIPRLDFLCLHLLETRYIRPTFEIDNLFKICEQLIFHIYF